MNLIGETGDADRDLLMASPRMLIRQHPEQINVQENSVEGGVRQAFSARCKYLNDHEFKREDSSLHPQHPRRHLSTRKLCSKPGQLREPPKKDRAGRSAPHGENATYPARGPRQSAKELETGHLPISRDSGRKHIRGTHFVGDGCCEVG